MAQLSTWRKITDRESTKSFKFTTHIMDVNELSDSIHMSSAMPFLLIKPDVWNAIQGTKKTTAAWKIPKILQRTKV